MEPSVVLATASFPRQDLLEPARSINYDGSEFMHNGVPVLVSTLAERQILDAAGIPVNFFHKCPTELRLSIFSCFHGRTLDRLHTLRFTTLETRRDHITGPKQSLLRAYLGSRYEPHDDNLVIPALFQALSSTAFECLTYSADEHVSQLTVRFSDVYVNHQGTEYFAGLRMTNSETGQSAIWIEPVVITNFYTMSNRHALINQKADIRTVHRTEFNAERVHKQVQFAKDIGQVGITQLLENKDDILTKDKVFAFLKAQAAVIPDRFVSILEDEWKEQQEVVRAAAWGAILNLAKELPLFHQERVQQAVGNWSGIFVGFKARMDSILEEIHEHESSL